jgi:hypothetical protein
MMTMTVIIIITLRMKTVTLKPMLILFCNHMIQLVGLSCLISLTKILYVFPISKHPCCLHANRHYSPGRALASSTTSIHCSLSLIFSLRPLTSIFFKSLSTSSSHLILRLPFHLSGLQHCAYIPSCHHDIVVPYHLLGPFSICSAYPRLVVRFLNKITFNRMPNIRATRPNFSSVASIIQFN